MSFMSADGSEHPALISRRKEKRKEAVDILFSKVGNDLTLTMPALVGYCIEGRVEENHKRKSGAGRDDRKHRDAFLFVFVFNDQKLDRPSNKSSYAFSLFFFFLLYR